MKVPGRGCSGTRETTVVVSPQGTAWELDPPTEGLTAPRHRWGPCHETSVRSILLITSHEGCRRGLSPCSQAHRGPKLLGTWNSNVPPSPTSAGHQNPLPRRESAGLQGGLFPSHTPLPFSLPLETGL